MKVPATVLVILATAFAVNASSPHDSRSLSSSHARIARRSPALSGAPIRKRCKPRSTNANNNVGNKSTSSPPKQAAPPPPAPAPVPAQDNNNSGVINVKSSCGNIGATKKTTKTSGPNGSIDWLNCGLTDGGWNPPFVKISDIVSVSLSSAISSGHGPFMACTNFVHLFERYGQEFGIPAIMLASFAMQESSCNPNTVGGGGEQGLMQITKEKCGGAPGGNCKDPDFNIRTGAKFFADTLNNNGGDLLLSIGSYNGWHKGLTFSKATAAAKSSCCRCQNNCDYLHQFLNGWIQNINAYDSGFRLGKFFNLDVC